MAVGLKVHAQQTGGCDSSRVGSLQARRELTRQPGSTRGSLAPVVTITAGWGNAVPYAVVGADGCMALKCSGYHGAELVDVKAGRWAWSHAQHVREADRLCAAASRSGRWVMGRRW